MPTCLSFVALFHLEWCVLLFFLLNCLLSKFPSLEISRLVTEEDLPVALMIPSSPTHTPKKKKKKSTNNALRIFFKEDVQLLLSYLVVQNMFHTNLHASFLAVANSQRVWENPTPYLLESAVRQH